MSPLTLLFPDRFGEKVWNDRRKEYSKLRPKRTTHKNSLQNEYVYEENESDVSIKFINHDVCVQLRLGLLDLDDVHVFLWSNLTPFALGFLPPPLLIWLFQAR